MIAHKYIKKMWRFTLNFFQKPSCLCPRVTMNSATVHRTPHIPHIHTCWFFNFNFQIQHTCNTHVVFMCTQVTHMFFMQRHTTYTQLFIFVLFRPKTRKFHDISLLWGQFYTIWTKNIRAVMFFGNFEQPCTEHEIWTSRLRSFEAKNMKKGKICVDNTKLFVIKGHFWLYFFESTQLLHTSFLYVYTTHTQLHTCHFLVFKYSTHVTHM